MTPSFRTALMDALLAEADKHSNLVVLTADLRKSLRLDKVQEKLGDRFVNPGICEANVVSMAAGLSTMGFLPVIVGFAVFAVEKPYEQIRQSIAYPNLNVKLIATHSGLSAGKDGATHQAIEDIAIMRAMPNMCVLSAADTRETMAAVAAILEHRGPAYLRLGRDNAEEVYSNASARVEIGGSDLLREGKDVAILATGVMVKPALKAAETLRGMGVDSAVVNLYSLKPVDEAMIVRVARQTGAVVTVEDHTFTGGLGGVVSEVLGASYPAPIERVGVKDQFGESGTQEDLFRSHGLDEGSIVRAAVKVVGRKAHTCTAKN